VAGRISEWDRRLESEGSVSFRPNPWLPLLLLLVCLVLAAGFVDALVADGASFWVVVGLVGFGLLGLPLAVRALVAARPALTVTPEGVRARKGPLVPLANVEAVTTRGRSLTLHYRPLPDEKLVRRQRKTGLKQLFAPLAPFSARAGDVAYWLLQRKGGPDARIDVSGDGGRLTQVYKIAEKRFWER
jgi:hypothetical protein